VKPFGILSKVLALRFDGTPTPVLRLLPFTALAEARTALPKPLGILSMTRGELVFALAALVARFSIAVGFTAAMVRLAAVFDPRGGAAMIEAALVFAALRVFVRRAALASAFLRAAPVAAIERFVLVKPVATAAASAPMPAMFLRTAADWRSIDLSVLLALFSNRLSSASASRKACRKLAANAAPIVTVTFAPRADIAVPHPVFQERGTV
jgi:hypothetical protein